MAEMMEQRAQRALPRFAASGFRPGIIAERLLLVMALVGAWWLLSLSAAPYVLPGPLRVWSALGIIAGHGDLWQNLGITFWRVTVGFAVAALVGLPLGIVLGANRRLGEFFEPVLPVLNTVSSAIWAIFAIIWFGISNATTIFVVFMTAMPLIITNVWQGTRAVNADFIELARVLRMPDWKIMAKIYLPTILPYFFSGARLAFGFGWRVSLVAETIGSSSGVGYRLRQAADLVRTDQVFAWTLTLVLLMAVLEMGILSPLERHLFRWKKEAAE
jgi:NitT/TauT family transport system permease protein